MTHPHQQDNDSSASHADTALDEVLKEFEDAETRDPKQTAREDAHDGEAGDALTPNEEAQEEAADD
ncbi:hypothetical protein N4G70_25830 [Streptomyces sp. ASQP_92]|uniref:hypothetical protein n=1 Tax=Streptomyces sp. ASQP_92 TaxID=2979116 RepID=UPI0021C0BEB1|nr:hypothetical protein [Streptomyces sp. ASQP_92]MCT9092266.1 hypothetical protein [Streptomyces sp. ASQP_92]